MNLLSLKNELMKHTGYFLEKSVKIVSKEICYSDDQYFCNNNFTVGRDFGIRCHVKGLNKKIELVLIPLPSFPSRAIVQSIIWDVYTALQRTRFKPLYMLNIAE